MKIIVLETCQFSSLDILQYSTIIQFKMCMLWKSEDDVDLSSMPTMVLLWWPHSTCCAFDGLSSGAWIDILWQKNYQVGRGSFILAKPRVTGGGWGQLFLQQQCLVLWELRQRNRFPYSALLWQTCSTAHSSQVRGLTRAVQTSTG